jgi:hypothetical protein
MYEGDEEAGSGHSEAEDATAEPGWFGVRCVFRWSEPLTYEERLTIWEAASLDQAIAMAEDDARAYAKRLNSEYLQLAQAYWIGPKQPGAGSEVFSLMRDSDHDPDTYLDTFFDTGHERQQISE